MEKNKNIDTDELILGQGDLLNAIKGIKILVDDRFTFLNSITIDDIDALNGLVRCIELTAKQQFDKVSDYFE